MDTVSRAKRSEIMRLVKSKDTKLEQVLHKGLRDKGYKFKKNVARLPGKPDLVFTSEKVAVFINSCFWHGCKQHCRMPATNRAYWNKKIAGNKKRDLLVAAKLRTGGWRVISVWEHSIKKSPDAVVRRILKTVSS
jgi:DNA mismatch endonuclease (patch repair protein)